MIFDSIIIAGLLILLYLDWQKQKEFDELYDSIDLVGGALVELMRDLHKKEIIESKALDYDREG